LPDEIIDKAIDHSYFYFAPEFGLSRQPGESIRACMAHHIRLHDFGVHRPTQPMSKVFSECFRNRIYTFFFKRVGGNECRFAMLEG